MKRAAFTLLLLLPASTAFAKYRKWQEIRLFGAVMGTDIDEVKKEIRRSRDLNEYDEMNGQTALMFAVKFGTPESVQALIDAGADINAKDRWGGGDWYYGSALAMARDKPIIEKILIDAGAQSIGGVSQRAKELIELRDHPMRSAQAPAPTPVPAPPSAPAVSREDMQHMIEEATRKAAKEAADQVAAKPAPAAPAPKPEAKPALKSDADVPTYKEPIREADVAVVVGVEKYADLPSADFAERDAKAVRDHLIALGYPPRHVILLTGASASRSRLVANIERKLPSMVKPESTVFFYYSGHGSPEAATGKAYLLPSDGDPTLLEDTGYPVARLYQKLGALNAKRVIVALDSCFSGAGGRSVLPKGTRPLVTKIDAGQVPAKLVSLTASQSDQISGTLEEQGHGTFTYFLLKGLSSGKRSTRALYDYLKPQVQDAARLSNRDQSPTMTGEDAPIQ